MKASSGDRYEACRSGFGLGTPGGLGGAITTYEPIAAIPAYPCPPPDRAPRHPVGLPPRKVKRQGQGLPP